MQPDSGCLSEYGSLFLPLFFLTIVSLHFTILRKSQSFLLKIGPYNLQLRFFSLAIASLHLAILN